jgi:glucoamylase
MHCSSHQLHTLHGAVRILFSELDHPDFESWWFLVTVNVPANTNIEYKYIRMGNGELTWESDPNNAITTPANGAYVTDDTWR